MKRRLLVLLALTICTLANRTIPDTTMATHVLFVGIYVLCAGLIDLAYQR